MLWIGRADARVPLGAVANLVLADKHPPIIRPAIHQVVVGDIPDEAVGIDRPAIEH